MKLKQVVENKNQIRKVIVRQIVISVVVIFLLPLFLTLINFSKAFVFYENTIKSFINDPVLVIFPAISIVGLSWLVGGRIENKIASEKGKTYWLIFFQLLWFWLGFFVSCMFAEFISKIISGSFNAETLESIILSWLLFGWFIFLFAAILHSSLLSATINLEIRKNK